MSLAILVSATASVLSAPWKNTSPSLAAISANLLGAGSNGGAGYVADRGAHVLGPARRRIEPGADRGAADRQLA